MVVSPYERERAIALTMLGRIGGQATLKLLDGVLEDVEVHEAYKLSIRQLRDTLEANVQRTGRPDEDEDEDEDEALVDELLADLRVARSSRDGDSGVTDDGIETEPAAAPADQPPEPARPRGRRRSRRTPTPPDTEPTATLDPEVFEDLSGRFAAALAASVDAVLDAFRQLPERKRLSFLDRAGRCPELRTPQMVAFLLPLVTATDWALVHTALNTIGELRLTDALPAVEEVARSAPRKRVQMRAERVRERLREALAADSEPATTPQPTPRRGPAPRPRGVAREASETGDHLPSAAASTGAEGVPDWLDAPAEPEPAIGEPWRASARPGRLQGCYASGFDLAGRQTMLVYRAGADDRLERLTIRTDQRAGWIGAAFESHLPPNTPAEDLAAAERRGELLVEVTVGYVRSRLRQAEAQSHIAGLPLPRDAEAAIAYTGNARATDTAADLPSEPGGEPSREETEALLDHPLCAGWWLPLRPDAEALTRWQETSRRRNASRLRHKIIDDLLTSWLTASTRARLIDLLRAQAVLLARLGRADLADVALRFAAQLQRGGDMLEHRLVREIAYRGVQRGIAERQASRRRQRLHQTLREARRRFARGVSRRRRRR